jgi:capsular exopolysaccharide synthesis family protein
MAGRGPIAPNNKLILAISVFISLMIPFIGIFLVKYFQGKISTKEDLLRNTDIPLLASIVHSRGKSTKLPVVVDKPRSLTAESFRLLKIEIDAVLPPKKRTRLIGISSSINREGKTFCATNLGCAFAQQGVKTLLLGVDLYKGEDLFSELDPDRSLSSYALGKTALHQTVQSTTIENLDVINPGTPLNNPSIFLQSEQFTQLMEEITPLYEVIVIDSSPLGFVSDFLIIEKYTNLNLFVTRIERSRIQYLDNLHELKDKKMIDSLYLVLNDVPFHSTQQLNPFGLIRRKNPYYHNN